MKAHFVCIDYDAIKLRPRRTVERLVLEGPRPRAAPKKRQGRGAAKKVTEGKKTKPTNRNSSAGRGVGSRQKSTNGRGKGSRAPAGRGSAPIRAQLTSTAVPAVAGRQPRRRPQCPPSALSRGVRGAPLSTAAPPSKQGRKAAKGRKNRR